MVLASRITFTEMDDQLKTSSIFEKQMYYPAYCNLLPAYYNLLSTKFRLIISSSKDLNGYDLMWFSTIGPQNARITTRYSFEEVLEQSPSEIQEKLLYFLDWFRC